MEPQETIASMLLEQFETVPEWMEQGKCADGELDPFYNYEKEAFIREKCNQCPVIQQCRQHFEDSPNLKGVFFGEEH